ncbi:hypothetical protein DRQ09_01640, partial [candidate division KSB1 bacterium]
MEDGYYLYIKRLFKKYSSFYDLVDIFISGVRHKAVELSNLKNGSRILDVCTGTGSQAIAFGKKGYNVVGLDLTEEMLKKAMRKNKYNNIVFCLGDAVNIPFRDGCFDGTIISFGLHEMPSSIRKKVLKEIIRVTRNCGKIIIVDYR